MRRAEGSSYRDPLCHSWTGEAAKEKVLKRDQAAYVNHCTDKADKAQQAEVSPPPEGLRAVTSRSHLDDATQAWIGQRRIRELKPSGPSLKFCAVAEGATCVYPRVTPTMGYDPQVLLMVGGRVVGLDGEDLRYGKPDYHNGHFVAWGGRVDE